MSRRRAVLSVVLGVFLLPSTAAGAPDWAPAINFPVPASDNLEGKPRLEEEIAYQDGGIANEAFLQVESASPIQTTLHVGTMAPGGAYTDQLTIPSSEGAIPISAQLAVAPNGAAVAAWAELTTSNLSTAPLRYRAAYRPAGSSTWEAPFTIAIDAERVSGAAGAMTTAIGSDGTAVVGVQHISSKAEVGAKGEPVFRLDVAVHPAGRAWTPAERINSPSEDAGESLQFGLDAQGNITAAFRLRFSESGSPASDRYTAVVRRRPASNGVWGPVEDITGSDITHSVYVPHLGENEAGDAVLTFQYGPVGSAANVWGVIRQGPNGAWTAPAELVPGTSGSSPVAAGAAPNGAVYILYWFQGNVSSGEDCEGVIRAYQGGSFSTPRCVSPPNEDTFSGSMAFLGNDAYFAWRGNVPGESSNASVQGARWADGAPQPDVARNLDPPGVAYGPPVLLNDDQGSVVAFYSNPTSMLRAAAYDAGPPILLGAGVPTSVTAGQPVTLSASFVDLWSGLGAGQPTWSFSDGTSPVSGSSVVHTFAAPGTYTITLSAADALANATSSTFTVTVKPVPPPPVQLDTQPPHVTLELPACKKKLSVTRCKRFRRSRKAWQTLRGAVSDPAPSSGIASVQVAIYRVRGKRVEGLSGGRFRKTTKAKARSKFTRASVSGGRWSLHLPTLSAGAYTILVRATDRAGNVSAIVSKTVTLP